MCVSISATVNLSCLFAPKVYIVLFQPHKNVRQGTASSGQAGSLRGRPFFGRSGASRFGGLGAMNGDIASPSNNNARTSSIALNTSSVDGCHYDVVCQDSADEFFDMDDLADTVIENDHTSMTDIPSMQT